MNRNFPRVHGLTYWSYKEEISSQSVLSIPTFHLLEKYIYFDFFFLFMKTFFKKKIDVQDIIWGMGRNGCIFGERGMKYKITHCQKVARSMRSKVHRFKNIFGCSYQQHAIHIKSLRFWNDIQPLRKSPQNFCRIWDGSI